MALGVTGARADPMFEVLREYEVLDLGEVPSMSARRLRSSGDALQFKVRALGEEHDLELEVMRNLFAPDFKHYFVDKNGAKTVDRSLETDCVFQTKQGSETNAIVSFCGGIVHARLLHPDGESLYVQPLESDASKHVAYRGRDLLEEASGRCGLDETNEMRFTLTDEFQNNYRELMLQNAAAPRRKMDEVRTVELVVVNDYERYVKLGSRVHASTAYIFSVVASTYNLFPSPYDLEMSLSAIYTMTEADPWNTVSLNNGKSVDVENLLNEFISWVNSNAEDIKTEANSFDLAHLLSGNDFYHPESGDLVVGLAAVGGWCTNSKAGVSQATFSNMDSTAAIMTHEIGHNLGFRHTNYDGVTGPEPCEDAATSYIMDPSTGSNPVWSSCSAAWLEREIILQKGSCTLNEAANIYAPPTCGDGLLQGDEECECLFADGSPNQCPTNSCCGQDCRLFAGKQCDSSSDCCDDECNFLEAGTVCRESDGVCAGAVEVCTGESQDCPIDQVAPTGTSCPNDGGCFLDECISLDDLCVSLGYVSNSNSENPCQEALKCRSENGNSYFPNGMFVLDGTPCGSGKQCYQGVCADSSTLPTPESLTSCSNGLQDNSETDVDCGGPDCLPCFGGMSCEVLTDCLFPAVCNETLGLCESPEGSGIRPTVQPTGQDFLDEAVELYEKVKEWAIQNPIQAGAAGLGLLLILIGCCWSCCCSSSKPKVTSKRVVQRQLPLATVVSPP